MFSNMGQYAHRSDDERAAVLALLAANGGNVSATSRETGVARSTVRLWRDEIAGAPPAETVIKERASLAERLDDIAGRAALIQVSLLEMAEVDPALALDHWADVNRAMGTAIDKALVLRGQPSEYHRHEVVLDLGAGEL